MPSLNLAFQIWTIITLNSQHGTATNQCAGRYLKNVDRFLTPEKDSVGSPSLHNCTTTLVENWVRHPELSQGSIARGPTPEPPEVPEPNMAKINGLQIVYTIPDLVASQVGVYLLGKAVYYVPQVYSRFVIP